MAGEKKIEDKKEDIKTGNKIAVGKPVDKMDAVKNDIVEKDAAKKEDRGKKEIWVWRICQRILRRS